MKKIILFSIIIILLAVNLIAQWSNDPSLNNAICALNGEQAIPKVATTSAGDTYIAWYSNDASNYDVRLQRLDTLGNEYWVTDGIIVSDNPAMTWLTDWDMTVDDDNHAILTFQDIRNAGNNNIYAYRIAPDGTFVWGEDGIELSNSIAFDASPKTCVTSTGNVIVTWQAEDVIIMQKIAPDGTLLWGPSGITMSCADTYSWPQPIAVEDDHILLKFFHDSGPAYAPTRHCFVQKYDTDGVAVWASDAIVSNAGGISAWTQVFSIESDGANGCFIAWHDDRDNNMDASSFVQHINSDGSVGFADDGVELSTQAARENYYPKIAFNSSTEELYVYWMETDGDQNQRGLYGQKLDASGNILWTSSGKPIIEISDTGVNPFAVRQANNDVIVCFDETVENMDSLIRATRLDADGEFVWVDDIVTMCSVASEKVHIEGSYFANDQIICTWEDDRNGGRDIYAQNINLDGTLGSPTANGTIEGSVVIDGGIGSVEDVLVTAGSVSVNPNADGDYIISISSGTYEVTASLEYYTPQTIIDVVVTEGNATTGIDFILDWIPVYNPPQNLAVNDITGLVTWDPPMLYPGAEVEGYNFYMDGAFVEYCELLSFQLENLINGVEYTIGITSVYDGGWESAIVEVIFFYNGTNAGNNLVATTKLMNNYPNPFNPITNISYSIKDRGNVTIEVYNLKGQLVKALVNETKEAGDHSVIWDGSDKLNKLVSSGIYLYRMKSNNSTTTKKMILLK